MTDETTAFDILPPAAEPAGDTGARPHSYAGDALAPGVSGTGALYFETADDPRALLSTFKGRVCAVEVVKGNVRAQVGEAHTFRVGRKGGREVLACTANLSGEPATVDGWTVGGLVVAGLL